MSAPGALAGRVVLVTRPRRQAAALSELLRARGARPLEGPTIRVDGTATEAALEGAVREAAEGGYAWVVFTSAAGVEAWSSRAAAVGVGPAPARLAAVGPGTAGAMRKAGLEPDLVPERYTTEALAEAFPRGSGRVLLPRADLATGELEEGLGAKGWVPVRVDAYRTTFEPELPEAVRRALDAGRVDAVTFTSTSTVEGFVRLVGVVEGPVVACIGPVTAEAARRAGLRVDAVADPHTFEALVDALATAFAERGR